MESIPHIAIVDDHKDIRELVGRYLGQHGCRVSAADSAASLRHLLQRSAPDLVVLDVMMPGEDGLSVCRYLRATSNVSSISARTGGSPGSSLYSGAKAFVSTFTRSLARELAMYDIRVNALSPGTIATAFHERHSTPEKLESTRKSIPMARLGAAEDCAGTALFLASDALSGYVTGQVIEVNGGQFMG